MSEKLSTAFFALLFGVVSVGFLWVGFRTEFFPFLIIAPIFIIISIVVFFNAALSDAAKESLGRIWSGVTFGFFSGLDTVRNQFHEPSVEPTAEERLVAREVAELVRHHNIHVIFERMPVRTWSQDTYDVVLIELWRPNFTADVDELDAMLAQMWLHAPQDTIMRADLLEHIDRHGQQDCMRAFMHMQEHGDLDRSGGLGSHFDHVYERLKARVGPLSEGGGQLSVVHDASSAGGLSLNQDSSDQD